MVQVIHRAQGDHPVEDTAEGGFHRVKQPSHGGDRALHPLANLHHLGKFVGAEGSSRKGGQQHRRHRPGPAQIGRLLHQAEQHLFEV
ncbi:MAG: hypothetical protein EA342_03500 [Leptolyngbya sp. LCM1.Bin17]|nr:MAG: hypothetical protein EA342_03500 [Leptolyngbya sp. LCM1.Bin17]